MPDEVICIGHAHPGGCRRMSLNVTHTPKGASECVTYKTRVGQAFTCTLWGMPDIYYLIDLAEILSLVSLRYAQDKHSLRMTLVKKFRKLKSIKKAAPYFTGLLIVEPDWYYLANW